MKHFIAIALLIAYSAGTHIYQYDVDGEMPEISTLL